MALLTVENFTHTIKNNKVHDKTIAEYSFFYNNDELYFQIDTYGTNRRQNQNKVSQSIQLNRDTAQYLINILKNNFNLN